MPHYSQIDEVAQTWNFHSIRHDKKMKWTTWKTISIMYSLPALYGADEQLKRVSVNAIQNCEEEYDNTIGRHCDEDVDELCRMIMDEEQLEFPADKRDMCDLYIWGPPYISAD